MSELASVLKEVLVLTGDGTRSNKVADLAGVSRDTVYAQCDHRCNPACQIVAAAFALYGDTRLKAALTPPGHEIVLCGKALSPKKPLAEEINDVFPALGRWVELIGDLGSDQIEADEAMTEAVREIQEAHQRYHIDKKALKEKINLRVAVEKA